MMVNFKAINIAKYGSRFPHHSSFAAIAFSGIALLVSKFLLKPTTNKQKGEPYECGVPTKGPTWVQFNVGYYLFALLFLLFDVELIFYFPGQW